MTIGKGKCPSGQKRDFMQVGRAIVEQAIGEQMDGSTLIFLWSGLAPVEIRLTHYRNVGRLLSRCQDVQQCEARTYFLASETT